MNALRIVVFLRPNKNGVETWRYRSSLAIAPAWHCMYRVDNKGRVAVGYKFKAMVDRDIDERHEDMLRCMIDL